MNDIKEIGRQLSACVNTNTEDITPLDGDTFFGLPKPYSVPTPANCEGFHEMYYWDTYFTNVGLLTIGNIGQAKNNAEDMIALIRRFGFIPNGSRRRYLYHSQPPFFAQIVKEIFDADGDEAFLARAYDAMKTEYAYWQKNRTFPNGLSHYGFLATDPELIASRINKWEERTGLKPDADPQVNVGNFIGYCESGWDCNPRWGAESFRYAPPDLNALLWNLEVRLAEFAEILRTGEAERWQAAADRRKAAMNALLWNPDGGYFADRQNESETFGGIFSAAAFYPLYFGLATAEQARATVSNLSLLERAYGVVSCEQTNKEGCFQWAAPNAWPCIQQMVIGALLRYGFETDAMRIAEKYVSTVEQVAGKTGQLWEKYDADTLEIGSGAEYRTPSMMGWTAGVYLKCRTLLRAGEETAG